MTQADKTKWKLANTLKSLCHKKPLYKITVTELIKAADVNRGTFYHHFMDINDLVSWICQRDMEQAQGENESEIPNADTVCFPQKVFEDHQFYKYVLAFDSKNGYVEELYKIIYEQIVAYVNAYLADKKPLSRESITLISKFYAIGMTYSAIDFINAETLEVVQEIRNKTNSFIESAVIGSIENLLKAENRKSSI